MKLTEEEIKEMESDMGKMPERFVPMEQLQQQQMKQELEAPEEKEDPKPKKEAAKEAHELISTEKEFAELKLLETVTEYLKA
jgi:hypothetical protein